jgi:hypothetical protein
MPAAPWSALDEAIRRARVKGSVVYEQWAQALLAEIGGSTEVAR